MDAAERLYALHGVSGVSLRQISAAAGSANNYAVQYHFGTGGDLIRAVLKARMPEVERQRAALLAAAKAADTLRDLRVLNDALYRPLVEHANERGERWFGRFVLALFSTTGALGHGRGSEQLAPVSEHILDLQCAANPSIPAALLRERHRWLVIMILTSVFLPRDQPQDHDEALLDNALDMATAALSAPVSKSVRAMLKTMQTRSR
ncbi:MAG: hypothetical protein ABW321_15850 [Polyangiales bacterium]